MPGPQNCPNIFKTVFSGHLSPYKIYSLELDMNWLSYEQNQCAYIVYILYIYVANNIVFSQ